MNGRFREKMPVLKRVLALVAISFAALLLVTVLLLLVADFIGMDECGMSCAYQLLCWARASASACVRPSSTTQLRPHM